jgi:soluble lytic murein transglycosylase
MSSMVRSGASLALLMLALASAPAHCQNAGPAGASTDRARAQLVGAQPSSITQAITRWQSLTSSSRYRFDDYAGFLLAYPGFPDEAKLRVSAEQALETSYVDPARVAAFFDRFAPVGNPARAQYAIALAQLRRSEASRVGVEAWRGGPMSDQAEATLWAQYGAYLKPEDHDARVDALLWSGDAAQAARWLPYSSAASRPLLAARLALVQGSDPASQGLAVPATAMTDPGYVYNLAQRYRSGGQANVAARLLDDRPRAAKVPLDQRKWISMLLAAARAGSASSAVQIASSIDDAFEPGADVSLTSFRIRDDYTSLMWLGGTKALWELRSPARAAPLFYRYGAAARTPQTRSKGFYWAGRALAQGGNHAEANRYFELAAQYGDHFYGMLALERLGRPLPNFHTMPNRAVAPELRAAFYAKPLTQAVRSVAQGADWLTTLKFFREISEEAKTEDDHLLVAELVRLTGRRDLGVILGQAAHVDGFGNFQQASFPLIETPRNGNWTMIHAITRQESQFAQNAISHAGARGLMQLMPGTAREQAGKMGLSYNLSGLIADPTYNVTLGDGYFRRMMNTYGSYPLAVAAYNAGPGNVNKWLRANGDPRRGEVDWIEWIEAIPFFETRNYVQRVLENAVVYEAMNPARASYRGPNPLSRFIGKSHPG